MNHNISTRINKWLIHWIYPRAAVLIQPELKSHSNIAKTAVVFIAMTLTAVTLAGNVSAAAADSTDIAPTCKQSVSYTQSPYPGYLSAALLTSSLNNSITSNVFVTSGLQMAAQVKETSTDISVFLDIVAGQIGKPYVFGRTGPSSFDCSGLVYYCLQQAGLSVERTSASGFSKNNDWEKITSMDDLKLGDILFFSTGGKKIGHTGIYIGDGNMIDASSTNGEVVQRSCTTSYWKNHFVFARRAFPV